jgi:tetratricopeptide (TPR) repeat protein
VPHFRHEVREWRIRFGVVKKLFSLMILGLLAGCQGLPTKARPVARTPAPAAHRPRPLPFKSPQRPPVQMDSELLYDYLVGEIGAREGRFGPSLESYLDAARKAHDAYAAERATRIALHMKALDTAREAAALWVGLAPNDVEARRYLGVLLLRKGDREGAYTQFDAMRRIAEARGGDGLLRAATVLAGEPDAKAARALFERLARPFAQTPKALYAGALLATAQHRFGDAEASLRADLRQRPKDTRARVLLSRVLLADKQADAAMQALAEGLALAPDDVGLRTHYARLLVGLGRYEKALAQFRELHRHDPKDVEVSYGYAMLASQQQHWDEARELWQALRKQPKYRLEASYFLGQVEESSGHPKQALALYHEVDHGPLQVDAAIRAAVLMQKQGQLQAALKLLHRVRAGHPKRGVDLLLTETQLLQEAKAAPRRVLAVYAEGLRQHPGSTELLYNRGLYYSKLSRYRDMEADFRAVLKRDPKHANALNALGFMLAERNIRLQEARGYIERALRLKPGSPAILDSMGWVLYRLGQYKQAKAYLLRAYAKDPDEEIAAHLVEVLWASGDRQGARRLLDQVSSEAPNSPFLSDLRGRLFADPSR